MTMTMTMPRGAPCGCGKGASLSSAASTLLADGLGGPWGEGVSCGGDSRDTARVSSMAMPCSMERQSSPRSLCTWLTWGRTDPEGQGLGQGSTWDRRARSRARLYLLRALGAGPRLAYRMPPAPPYL